jgi:preprotein translocase subunit SecG
MKKLSYVLSILFVTFSFACSNGSNTEENKQEAVTEEASMEESKDDL